MGFDAKDRQKHRQEKDDDQTEDMIRREANSRAMNPQLADPPKAETRSKRIVICVTPTEQQQLMDLAAYTGRSMSDLVHEIIASNLAEQSDKVRKAAEWAADRNK